MVFIIKTQHTPCEVQTEILNIIWGGGGGGGKKWFVLLNNKNKK
jgi:hypothetical protein